MIQLLQKLLERVFGADEPQPELSPEDLAAAEHYVFEIFAQQKAHAWQPVGAVLFSPRLRRTHPQAPHLDQGLSSLFAKGWVETHNVRFLVLTDAGYQRMLTLGIRPDA